MHRITEWFSGLKPNILLKAGLTLNAELVAQGFVHVGLKNLWIQWFLISLGNLLQCLAALKVKKYFMSSKKLGLMFLPRTWFCLHSTSRCHSLAETVEVCLGYDRHVKNCGSLRSYMKCSTSNRTGQNKHTFQVIKILNFYLRTVIVARDHAEWESMCILQWKH